MTQLAPKVTKGLCNRFIVPMDLPQEGRFGFNSSIVTKLRNRETSPVYGNGTIMPFCSGSFDFVILTEVVEHIRDDTDLVEEIYRVLRPGGKVFITTPNSLRTPVERGIKEHFRHYKPEELAYLFKKFDLLQRETRFKGKVWWYVMELRRGFRRGTQSRFINLTIAVLTFPSRIIGEFLTRLEDRYMQCPGDNIVMVVGKPDEYIKNM